MKYQLFAKDLRQFRKLNNMSLPQASALARISSSTLYRAENCATLFSVATFETLLRYMRARSSTYLDR